MSETETMSKEEIIDAWEVRLKNLATIAADYLRDGDAFGTVMATFTIAALAGSEGDALGNLICLITGEAPWDALMNLASKSKDEENAKKKELIAKERAHGTALVDEEEV